MINDKGINSIIEISDSCQLANGVQIQIFGSNNALYISENTKIIGGILEIRGHNSILKIGSDCTINAHIRCRSNQSKIEIGDNTTIGFAQISTHEEGDITLGKDCMLSGDITMDVSDMHSILDLKTQASINPPASIDIGDHVWIAHGAAIAKGVTIGSGSVIGAKSFVNKDVEKNSIYAGVPAKKIKEDVCWDRRILPL